MGSGVILTSMDVINQLVAAMQTLGIQDNPTDYLYAMRGGILGYVNKWDIANSAIGQGSVSGSIITNPIITGPVSGGLTPILPEAMFRVEIAVTFGGSAPKLHKVTIKGGQAADDKVLSAVAFVSGVPQAFDTLVTRGEIINFYMDQACNIDYFKLREVLPNS